MPLSTQTPALREALEGLFDFETIPQTTEEAARRWAKVYADYVKGGGVAVGPGAENVLEASLVVAFRPELAGGGLPLFIQAITAFWLAPPLQVPAQAAAVATAVIPVGSPFPLLGQVPDTATTSEQAAALAQSLSAFTLASVIVTPTSPPGPPTPIL